MQSNQFEYIEELNIVIITRVISYLFYDEK